jgi:hypothetical protein
VTYTVTAADSSTQAYTVTVTGGGGTAPAAPTGVTATPGNGQVTISWNAVSGATSYNIYWSTTDNVTKANGKKFTGVVSPQLLTNLTSGITYYFVVTAVNAYGESGESSQVNSGPSPGTLRVLPGYTLSACIDNYTRTSYVTPQTLMAAGGSPFAYYQWDSFGFPMGTTVSAFSGVFSSNGGLLSGKSQESVTIKVYDGTQTATGNTILYIKTISSAPVNGIPGVTCPWIELQQYPSGSFTLDGAVANKPYGATLFAIGGTPPYSWSEDTSYSGSGDFHLSGLTIDMIHGLVRGTLMNSSSGKTLRFKVIVKDTTGETASGPVYSIAVQ